MIVVLAVVVAVVAVVVIAIVVISVVVKALKIKLLFFVFSIFTTLLYNIEFFLMKIIPQFNHITVRLFTKMKAISVVIQV